MKVKGVVMAKKKNTLTFLLEGGEFYSVSSKIYPFVKVGDELYIQKRSNKSLYMVSLAATLLLLIGMTQFFLAPNPVYGYVTLDVNPSLEIAIDKREKVVDVTPLNSMAEQLLSEIDIKGTNIEHALTHLFEALFEGGYILDNTDLIFSTVTVKTVNSIDFSNKLEMKVGNVLEHTNLHAKSHVVVASVKDRETAYTKGISTAKQVVSEVIAGKGLAIEGEQIKARGINNILTENGLDVRDVIEESRARGIDKNNNGNGSNANSSNNGNSNNNGNNGNNNDRGNSGNNRNNGSNVNDKNSSNSGSNDNNSDNSNSGNNGNNQDSNNNVDSKSRGNNDVNNLNNGNNVNNGSNGNNYGNNNGNNRDNENNGNRNNSNNSNSNNNGNNNRGFINNSNNNNNNNSNSSNNRFFLRFPRR